jgi:2-iminoacetate synthase
MHTPDQPFSVDEASIQDALSGVRTPDPAKVREILEKAAELGGLEEADLPPLMALREPWQMEELFSAARRVKEAIYGNRIVLFAPLYVSNLCANECRYCGFRASNRDLPRRALGQEEIALEVRRLLRQGHKRVLLVSGEAYPPEGLDFILRAIRTVYATREGASGIRRLNVNIAPLTVEEFRRLAGEGIGTYQLFQETYHRATYAVMHPRGKKADFEGRLGVMDRAMQAGIDDVGIGALFGLHDWRFELLALLQHARHLESRFGCGPHTISVPRIEPAEGSGTSMAPPQAVDDASFRKLVAILRLAVPYTGLILSTRERAEVRDEVISIGISQASAGSRTSPGGYGTETAGQGAQFSLGDHRSLDEVVHDLCGSGHLPSFCTSCYRMGRTGAEFMHLAKPGDIKLHCQPNALASLREFREDHASAACAGAIDSRIAAGLESMDPAPRAAAAHMVARVRAGERDVYS